MSSRFSWFSPFSAAAAVLDKKSYGAGRRHSICVIPNCRKESTIGSAESVFSLARQLPPSLRFGSLKTPAISCWSSHGQDAAGGNDLADLITLCSALATLGIAFFAGVSEAQLFMESRFVHLAQFFRGAVEKHRAEFQHEFSRTLPVGRFLVPGKDGDGKWRRATLEFTMTGLGGAAPSFFHYRPTAKFPFLGRSEGVHFFEDWPRSLYGDFHWPRTVPIYRSYTAVRRWAREESSLAPTDENRERRHGGATGTYAAQLLRTMWMWRRLMTVKWMGIILTLSSSIAAIVLAVRANL